MEPNISYHEKIISHLLLLLFEEIDINSRGEIEWKDFVNYIILLSDKNSIENSYYVLHMYNQSINIVFYNMEKKKVEAFEIDIMETHKETNNLEINELNIKSEKMVKIEEEEKNKKLEKFNNKLNEKLTPQNNQDNNILRDQEINKDKIQRIPTPENVKNEIDKIKNLKINSPINTISTKKIYENFYPIKVYFSEEYDIIFISSSNYNISVWKFVNKKYKFKYINKN